MSEVMESISSEPDQSNKKGMRRFQVMQACGVVCVLVGIVFIFALPPFLERMIVSQAIDQVILAPDN